MTRLVIPALFLLSEACATGAAGAHSAAVPGPGADPARMAEFEERSAEQTRRLGELEARIALLEQEGRSSRPEAALKPSGTVHIGRSRRSGPDDDGGDSVSSDDDSEIGEAETSGRLPSLRLVGGGSSGDAENWAPPALPPGLPGSLAVAPLPTADPKEQPSSETLPANSSRARYRAALRLVHERAFAQALSALGDFLAAYPEDALADDAMYWRGEVHYAERRYQDALTEFTTVLTRFPAGGRVPEALLKVGMCHRRLGDSASAGTYFRRLREQFPDTEAARLVPEEGPS